MKELQRNRLRFVDLFCGIGGFHVATTIAGARRGVPTECVFASDVDGDAKAVYAANFGHTPAGDITAIDAESVPAHDLLFAGFPCQPFSICGDGRGFADVRGTLFWDIVRILDAKRPAAFVLENVKQLRGHDGGRTLATILQTLIELGYTAHWTILNALDFGLPQKRERIFIAGFREPRRFVFPVGTSPMQPLADLLEMDADVSAFYRASDTIRQNRLLRRAGKKEWNETTVWHENKGGDISALPYSCALRAGASYNYLLVNGERRFTERELLRLQGFPESFGLPVGYQAARRLTGNSVAIPCVAAVIGSVLDALIGDEEVIRVPTAKQVTLTL